MGKNKLDGSDPSSDSSNIYNPDDWAGPAPLAFAPFNPGVSSASFSQNGNQGSKGQGHGGPHGSVPTYDQVSADGHLKINLIWEPSVANAPTVDGVNLFKSDVIAAAKYLTAQFHDDVTLNFTVGYGTVDGSRVPGNYLGESITNLVDHAGAGNPAAALTFDSLNAALNSDAAKDNSTIHYPASDPTSSGHYWLTTAQAKALGLDYTVQERMDASSGGVTNSLDVDGHIGFNGAKNEFDYTTTAQGDTVTSGQYDLYATVLHEMTEAMGRMLFAGTNVNGVANSYEPLDLFRFTNTNTPDTSTVKGGYFSVDNGATPLHTFNGSTGDYGDWAVSQGPDAFNTNGTTGVLATHEGAVPEFDLQTLDAIGWDHLA